jgi:hypothetical protein
LGGGFDAFGHPLGNPRADLLNSTGGGPDHGSDAGSNANADPIDTDRVRSVFQPGGIFVDQSQLALGGCE